MPWKRCLPQSGSSSKHVAKKYRLSEDIIVTPDREERRGNNSFLHDSTHSPRELVKKVRIVQSMNFHARNDNRKKILETNMFRPIGAEEREERDSISLAGRRCPVFKSIVRGRHHVLDSNISQQKAREESTSASVFRPVRPIAMRRTAAESNTSISSSRSSSGSTSTPSMNIKHNMLDDTQTHIRTYESSVLYKLLFRIRKTHG